MVKRMRKQLGRFGRDRRGASAIDYCLMAVLVSIFIMATVNFLSTQINALQTTVTNAVEN